MNKMRTKRRGEKRTLVLIFLAVLVFAGLGFFVFNFPPDRFLNFFLFFFLFFFGLLLLNLGVFKKKKLAFFISLAVTVFLFLRFLKQAHILNLFLLVVFLTSLWLTTP